MLGICSQGIWGICSKVGILEDPFKEVHLTQLNEAHILRVLTETLVAHILTPYFPIRLCQFE